MHPCDTFGHSPMRNLGKVSFLPEKTDQRIFQNRSADSAKASIWQPTSSEICLHAPRWSSQRSMDAVGRIRFSWISGLPFVAGRLSNASWMSGAT